jgi:DNA polymerase I
MATIFDIETDGLYPDVSKVWCLVTLDTDTNEVKSFSDYDPDLPSLQEGLDHLSKQRIVAGHNIIGYDLMVLDYLLGFKLPDTTIVYDTWLMSLLLRYKRKHKHGLEGWGEYLGFAKLEFNEWNKYSKDMLTYCIRDVELNGKVYLELAEEAKKLIKVNPMFKLGLQAEMEFAKIESEIRANGWLFDIDKANQLLKEMNSRMLFIEQTVEPQIGMICLKVDPPNDYKKPAWRKDGCYVAHISKYFDVAPESGRDMDTRLIDGEYCRVSFEQGSMSSDKVLKQYLYSIGWQPDEWNMEKLPSGEWIKKSPKLTDTSLEKLGKVGLLISEYNTLKNRRGILEGWVQEASRDGRLHGRMWTIGTPTFRCRHEVVANLPSVGTPYGEEMRSLLICEPNKVIIGADSSGNQMRGLCHYIGNDEFTNEVINGDVHQKNADILSGVYPTERKKAKPWLYAYLFGAGAAKLGNILTGSSNKTVGEKSAKLFESSIPGLKELKDKLSTQYDNTSNRFGSDNAFIRGLDGRIIFTGSKHQTLNYLLQSAEGITCKYAAVYLKKKLNSLSIPHYFAIHYHDELAVIVDKEYKDQVAKLAIEAFTEAPKEFGIMCMSGDAKVGYNYAEVH